jgi:outer membrane immunogenic protein
MSRALLLASAAVGVAMLPLGAAQAQTPFDWSGFYAGVHGGFLDGNVHATDESIPAEGNLHGPVAGVLAGFNLPSSQLAPLVVGLEADIGFGDLRGSGVPAGDGLISVFFNYDFDWDAHIRVRAGVPIGNALAFIAAGAAFAQLHVTEGGISVVRGGIYTGGSIGAGVDFRLGPKVIARVEGLADRYIRKEYDDYSVDFTAWTARAALIVRLP